jgi:hypothetical protein
MKPSRSTPPHPSQEPAPSPQPSSGDAKVRGGNPSRLLIFRLLLVAGLLVGWLGYLAYLVWELPETEARQALILSRPQLLVSEVDVVAQVSDPGEEVVIERVLYQQDGLDLKPGDRLAITNLKACRSSWPPSTRERDDWVGEGLYLLPLRRQGSAYEVVRVPASPGYTPETSGISPLRIYPATPRTLAQYQHLEKMTR